MGANEKWRVLRLAQVLRAMGWTVAIRCFCAGHLTAALFGSSALLISSSTLAVEVRNDIGVEISRIGDASHLEFFDDTDGRPGSSPGKRSWKYDLLREQGVENRKEGRVVLRLQGLKPESIARLKGHSDNLIHAVTVNEQGVDETVEVSFTLSNNVDFFDYISDQPSRLVVDFFLKDLKDPKTLKDPKEEPSKVGKKTPKMSGSKSDDEGSREPAGGDFVLVAKGELPPAPSTAERFSSMKGFTHGIFDGGDPEFRRFSIRDFEIKEDAIIAGHANIYIPFPMLELGSPHLKSLLETPPEYEIVPAETQENKEARFLLMLFSNKRRAVFLKTAQEFLKKYPKSPYDEIVRYMMADIQFALWRSEGFATDFEAAMGTYTHLTEKYHDSPMTERTLLLMGYAQLERGDSFAALKTFQRFARLKPDSKHVDQVKISIAEAFLKLNRFDDAFTMLDEVEKGGRLPRVRHEAAFRKGDVSFRKKDFSESIRQYRMAIEKYPESASKFPNAWYNTAEAEFVGDRYKEALEAYRAFLQKFPDHDHGGYAMTRMGELLQIFGVDRQRVAGAFLESNFRYRATPGAGVARIRFLTGRMSEMKDKELADALREIALITEKYANRPKSQEGKSEESVKGAMDVGQPKDVAHAKGAADEKKKTDEKKTDEKNEKEHGDSKIAKQDNAVQEGVSDEYVSDDPDKGIRKKPELHGIEEFSTILIADGYNSRGDYDTAAGNLIAYYQKNPQSLNKEKIKARIVQNFTEGIRAAVDRGDFIDALRRYSRESAGWLKNTGRIDTRYYVGRAYEQAGVFKEATAIYSETLKQVSDLKGSSIEKERNVFEKIPKADSVRLRLAAVAAHDQDFARAETHLKAIRDEGSLDGPERIERAEISVDVAEARGQVDIAKRYLADLIGAWKGEEWLTGPLHLRLARLLVGKNGSKNRGTDRTLTTTAAVEADAHLLKILHMPKEDGGASVDDVRAQALELRGDILLARGKRAEAVAVYRDLLDEYERKRPLSSIRYRAGQILYEDGDLKGAETLWSELKPEKDDVWHRLASEQMRSAKWRAEYKKYIERIPAAADMSLN